MTGLGGAFDHISDPAQLGDLWYRFAERLVTKPRVLGLLAVRAGLSAGALDGEAAAQEYTRQFRVRCQPGLPRQGTQMRTKKAGMFWFVCLAVVEVVAGCGWLWMVVAGCGWLWLVVAGCGWLWLVVAVAIVVVICCVLSSVCVCCPMLPHFRRNDPLLLESGILLSLGLTWSCQTG